jgi:hypothetical protein
MKYLLLLSVLICSSQAWAQQSSPGLPAALRAHLTPQLLAGQDVLPQPSTHLISADGEFIIVGYENGDIRFFDFDSGKQVATLKENTTPVNFLALMDDGKVLVATFKFPDLKIWSSYYFDIRNLDYRVIVGIVDGYSSDKLLEKVIVNYSHTADKSILYPDSPVSIPKACAKAIDRVLH